ncbi:MAG: hypothetical protein ABIY36_01815 [Candidatus Limnocylindria bacterium]
MATPPASGSDEPSPSIDPSATDIASPTADPAAHPAGTVVSTSVDLLSVRTGPSIDVTRLGSLALGEPAYVVAGPTAADGFQWYQVAGLGIPWGHGCTTGETEPITCPNWFGWVADASDAGEPWLTVHDLGCPARPLTAESVMVDRTKIERLACFGSDAFTFRAWWPPVPEDAAVGGACSAQDEPSGWLLCQNINYNFVMLDEDQGFGPPGIGAVVSINPGSALSMPAPRQWVELTVHLDDPAAQGCDDAAAADDGYSDAPDEQLVLECRAEMVVESVEVVAGP